MSWAFLETCNYSKCKNKNKCVRYSSNGVYNMKFICAEKDYKWMVSKAVK